MLRTADRALVGRVVLIIIIVAVDSSWFTRHAVFVLAHTDAIERYGAVSSLLTSLCKVSADSAKESRMDLAVRLADVVRWELGHAQWWMRCLGSSHGAALGRDCHSSSKAIPFRHFILANGLHALFVDPLHLFCLFLRPRPTKCSDDTGSATYGVCSRLVLRLFDFSCGPDLV